jgi:hypothetical protein
MKRLIHQAWWVSFTLHRHAQPGGLWQVLFLDIHESPQGFSLGPQCLQQAGDPLVGWGVRVEEGMLVRVAVGASVVMAPGVAVGILPGVGVSVIVGVIVSILVFFRFSSDLRKSNNAKPKDAQTPSRIDRATIMIILKLFRSVGFIK